MKNVKVTNMTEREYRAYKLQRRRSAMMKKVIFRFVSALVLVIAITVGCKFASSKAAANNEINECKFYKTVNLSYDQTLLDVATENFDNEHYSSVDSYLNEIKSINHITDDTAIMGGKLLYIPYYAVPDCV